MAEIGKDLLHHRQAPFLVRMVVQGLPGIRVVQDEGVYGPGPALAQLLVVHLVADRVGVAEHHDPGFRVGLGEGLQLAQMLQYTRPDEAAVEAEGDAGE